ncbi:hypothetical protein D0D70_23925 [Vibrio parahaemolyticus]|uniref:hypothetical protein n=1 Tax=Vibrio sp. B1ASS3 TaxID=2751176 RepID=UPI0015F525D0|nr:MULTISPECIES: hypothetical protein [Vibrio]EGR1579465.1 hypothetical protein [Vibrio parahaemolyticus]EJE8516216.1 hypothetical protein [Vibrio parahaemolyticus]EJE8775012.1 hypothetical protein [Vibrio parahaemolyticus]CAD7828372.1 hypothetical protein ACOMICROBIO_NCLOACGD_05803 [Vibrio sp. B1ASS3]CAE6969952.1 hypothetical protein ACOMICROBIO_NCLOACGD_05803 [Vibrio sp. B1ASS3]
MKLQNKLIIMTALFSTHTYASWPPLILLDEGQLSFFKCIRNASTTSEKEHCLNHLPEKDRVTAKQYLIELETANDATKS